MLGSESLFFGAFTVFILLMLLLDLGVFSRKSHEVSFKEAAIWSAVWVSFAVGFYFFLLYYGDMIHGIQNIEDIKRVIERYASNTVAVYEGDFEKTVASYRKNMALEYITGYLLEYSLSADNIFVMILIFNSFHVKERYYKKVLFWGILGALVMRFIFIFVGAALIAKAHWMLYLFGAFLLFTGIKMLFDKEKEKEIDPQKHPVVRFASKYLSVYPRYERDRFFVKKEGKFFITPLFLVVLIIEFTDLIFAVDSIPAIFGVTRDPYVVFFSNIFAILGLRSMFFFLANIMNLFHYLKYGLAVLLSFIGAKLLAEPWLDAIGFERIYSFYAILIILGTSIAASLLFPPKKEEAAGIFPEKIKEKE